MSYRSKGAAIALTALMVFMSSALVARGAETTPDIPITPAADAPNCAIFFADNMAFTPQWRIGNLVRIEVMVLNLIDVDLDGADLDDVAAIPLDVNTDRFDTSLVYDQATLIANPSLILNTWMVSVPSVTVTMSLNGVVKYTYKSDFTVSTDVDEVTREINKVGHFIYGMQWDTATAEPGIYKVSVEIPTQYGVYFAVRHLLLETEGDPVGYEVLPADTGASGTGGTELPNNAFINLGVLMKKGGSSGGGGNGGGGSGGHHHHA